MVELRRRLRECLECGAADEAQLRIAQGSDRGRARPPVDHGELADDRTGSEYGEDALPACRRGNARLEQAVVNPIAAVALLPRHEQGLGSCERNRARLGEQTLRQLRGQTGQQTFRSRHWLYHRQPRPFGWTHPQPREGLGWNIRPLRSATPPWFRCLG